MANRHDSASCVHVLPGLVGSLLVALLLGGCGEGGVGPASGQGADPVVVDVPIAYVKRPAPALPAAGGEADDARRLLVFDPGADLWLRDRAAPSAAERNVTGALTQGQYDIRDVNVSFDGERLLFAMRGPYIEGADDDEQPTWNVWEYDRIEDRLQRVITSDITAESGHDRAPAYLPDGRIVFTSTRQRAGRAVLLDEGKPQFDALDEDRNEPAFVLHVMNADGTDIRQISFNQSHDRDPAVHDNGQLVFSRWDRAVSKNGIHLYRMNPDGTGLELLYGANSHATGTGGADVEFLRPRPLADGRLLALLRPFVVDDAGADLVLIDVDRYVENTQPVAAHLGVLSGPAQLRATVNDVRTDGTVSPGGRYSSAWPVRDGSNRLFVTWSLCRLSAPAGTVLPCTPERLADPSLQPAPPLYGVYLYDRDSDTQRPLLQPAEGLMYTEVVTLASRPLPPILFDQAESGMADPRLVESGTGILNIRSVYDVNGIDTSGPGIATLADPALRSAGQRPARFLRIVKAVPLPDRDVHRFRNTAFGRGGARVGMREIIGYVPIEPDGSVVVEVPANVPLALSVLDGDARRRSSRHLSWLQVRPGQELKCAGCHSASSGLSHGRADAFESIWAGAQTTGEPFPNTRAELFTDFGETMAEVRARVSCALDDCAAIRPSVDVSYEDVWTDEASAGRPPDDSFAWRYADLETPAPASEACQAQWTPLCRTVIHYESHIHPLWSLPREVIDPDDGVTVLADHTCTTCHSREDDAGAIRVPAANLDLGDGISPAQPDHFNAYRELLFPRNDREVMDGILQERLVEVGIDPETEEPILETVPMAAPLIHSRARGGSEFFDRFAPGGSHEGWLGEAELRLISEWVDIGAQYFNNPFDAPAD